MPVNGFTVGDVVRLVNLRLRAHAAAIPKRAKIAAIDDAHSEFWRTAVLANTGWFVRDAAVPLTVTDDETEYELPDDFYRLYFLAGADGAEELVFEYAPMTELPFVKHRRTGGPTPSGTTQYFYDIVGSNPASIVFSRPAPVGGGNLTVNYKYVRLLDRLTAEADSIDEVAWPFVGAAADYAAGMLAGGVGDSGLAQELMGRWAAKREEIVAMADRNVFGPMAQTGLARTLPAQRAAGQGSV